MAAATQRQESQGSRVARTASREAEASQVRSSRRARMCPPQAQEVLKHLGIAYP